MNLRIHHTPRLVSSESQGSAGLAGSFWGDRMESIHRVSQLLPSPSSHNSARSGATSRIDGRSAACTNAENTISAPALMAVLMAKSLKFFISLTLRLSFLLAITILSLFVTVHAEDVLKNAGGTTQTATISTFPSPVWMTLSTAISTGATTTVVKETPLAGFNSDALALIVEPFTTNAETRAVNSASGSTFTMASAWKFSHPSNSNVRLIEDGTVSPVMYGAKADATTDDWRAVQRASLEAEAFGGTLKGGIDIEARAFILKQQVYHAESIWKSIRFVVLASFPTNLVQTAETNVAALLKTARNRTTFSGYADTNTIVFPPGGSVPGFTNLSVGQNVAFNNPYGETLPGGIISGRLYKIKTLDDAAGWMTISDIMDPTTELDITSDGTGHAWGHMNELTRVKWDNVRIDNRATNLNSVYMCLQQPAETRGLRNGMDGVGLPGSTNIGVQIVGQISAHYNMESDPRSTNQVGLMVSGFGHEFDKFTGNGNGLHSVIISGQTMKFGMILAEQTKGPGVVLWSGTKGAIIQSAYWSAFDTATPFLQDISAATSTYDLGPVTCAGSNNLITSDATRGCTNRMWDGSADSGVGDTDNNSIYPGHYQSHGVYAPVLKMRRTQNNVNNNRSLRHIDEAIWFDSTAASRTGTLASATGWNGLVQTVAKATAANSVYVAALSGQTINGSSSMVQLTNQYQVMRFVADGGTNWRLLGN